MKVKQDVIINEGEMQINFTHKVNGKYLQQMVILPKYDYLDERNVGRIQSTLDNMWHEYRKIINNE